MTLAEIHWGAYTAKMGIPITFSEMDTATREAIEAGALAVADHVTSQLDTMQAAIDDEPKPITRYALVEQMGFRRTYGTVRETEFCGRPMLEVTSLETGAVQLAAPESLYALTWLTKDQAERATKTGAHSPAAIGSGRPSGPWTVDESQLDEDDEDQEMKDIT